MQLKKVQYYISLYKTYLSSNALFEETHKWETLRNFQQNWDIEAPDFGGMYNSCLQNSETKRLWKGENFFPKEMMMKFIQLDAEFVRRMFRDLFNEEKEIEGRISRFTFGMDEMLKDYKKSKPNSIENNHFHNHNHVVSMYLAFQFPEKYSIFQYPEFSKMMEKLATPNIPGPYEIDRFFKINRTLYKLMTKDPEIEEMLFEKLMPLKHFMGPSLLLVHDFYTKCSTEVFENQFPLK